MDNASVHNSQETLPMLLAILNVIGARLIFLPRYSPELNPCELAFAQSKRFLRTHRNAGVDFAPQVVASFEHVTLANVYRYYQKCLFHFADD